MSVLNFGSLNIDYVYDVAHIVQPGETISAFARRIFAGGKGLNQSVALAKAGAEVFHAGCAGYDGALLIQTLEDAGVDTEYIQKREDIQSGHTIIQVDEEGQNCIIVFGGTNREITRKHMDDTLRHFGKEDFLLLQNEMNDTQYLIEQAAHKGMHIVLNPSPIDEKINSLSLEKVEYFIVNEIEGAQIAGAEDVNEIIPNIAAHYPNAKVLLTLGEQGSKYFDGVRMYEQSIYSVKVEDTTAAGDTFLGYFLSGIARGIGTEEILRMAARASSIAVSHKGAAESIPSLDAVIKCGR